MYSRFLLNAYIISGEGQFRLISFKAMENAMLRKIHQNRADLALTLMVALLPLLFFWRLWALIPADQQRITAGDFTEQYYPLRAFTATAWAAGRAPLWNPAIFGGQPALADIQSGALYPPHVLQAMALGWAGAGFSVQALEWQVIFHFSIAGVGAFWLGRYWGRRAGASFPSARLMGLILSLVFTYSGYLTGFPVQQTTILQVSAWLPWVMWLQSRLLDALTGGELWPVAARRAAEAAPALALAILAGHPQTVMYIVYLTLAYLGLRMLQARAVPWRKIWMLPVWWGVSLSLAGLISAGQLWPTLEFIRRSLRADLAFEAVAHGLPLSELVSALYPGWLGGSPEYVGVFTLMLIAAALVLARPAQRSTVLFWVGVGLAALLLAFGKNTFFYPLVYLSLPGFDSVRQQERVFLLYSFSAAVLSGYGALFLSRAVPKALRLRYQLFLRRLAQTGGAALALTGLFVYGWAAASVRGDTVNLFYGVLRHHLFGLLIFGGGLVLLALRPRLLWRRGRGQALIIGWLAFNLFSMNWQFNLQARPANEEPFARTGAAQFLLEQAAQQPQPVRIAGGGFLSGGNNAASVYGLEDITGNTPLQLADVDAFAEQIPSWRLWQLFNVRYVVDERDLDGPGLERRYEADNLKVFEVGDPFERARMVYRVISGADWRMLAAEETDLKSTALVAVAEALNFTEPAQPAQVKVTEAQPGVLAVAAQTETAGLLVLSNVDYPGWQATVDGQPTAIYRTNGIFQGVVVPAGTHQVRLVFRPVSVAGGLWLSVVGLVTALALIFRPAGKSAGSTVKS